MNSGERLRGFCENDEEMYRAFRTLGLFLDPARIKQKTEEFVMQTETEERDSSIPSENARHLYRILMRLALARNDPNILRKYAEKENHFFHEKVYTPFIIECEKAVRIAQRYYAGT